MIYIEARDFEGAMNELFKVLVWEEVELKDRIEIWDLRSRLMDLKEDESLARSKKILYPEFKLNKQQVQRAIIKLILTLEERVLERNNISRGDMPPISIPSSRSLLTCFFGASPVDQKRTYIEFEVEEIRKCLGGMQASNGILFESSMASSTQDIVQTIMVQSPDIVHFAGHGNEDGIFVMDENNKSELLTNDMLEDICLLFSEVVNCVVFTSCFSKHQGEIIKKAIPYVLGTNAKVTSGQATLFSSRFYEALNNGKSIEFSFGYAQMLAINKGYDPSGIFML